MRMICISNYNINVSIILDEEKRRQTFYKSRGLGKVLKAGKLYLICYNEIEHNCE